MNRLTQPNRVFSFFSDYCIQEKKSLMENCKKNQLNDNNKIDETGFQWTMIKYCKKNQAKKRYLKNHTELSVSTKDARLF